MTIRTTVNETILSSERHHSATPGRGEGIEHVINTAAPTGIEARDIDAREVGQSTTPGGEHNGPTE